MERRVDVVVVGAGPNGMAAAIEMAAAGRRVLVLEEQEVAGGGLRTAEATLPGFHHDLFSAVHPLAAGSPFFRRLPLAAHGLEWIEPPAALAHPLDDGRVPLLERSLDATAGTLGADGDAYRALVAPFSARWDALVPDVLAPLGIPRHPLLMARFGLQAFRSAEGLARGVFREDPARALLAGISGHAAVPLDRAATAAFALVLLAACHAVGWPIPRGGSGSLARALLAHLESLGGEVRTGRPVRSLADLPPARAVFFDLTPRQLLRVLGDRLSGRYRRALERFRYGQGVFKVDWALSEPIPWRAAECRRAGTLHLGGTLDDVARAERDSWEGGVPERPLLIAAQPSLFDPTRAPQGRHTAWAYCHVPNGCEVDMTETIEGQIERYAPGFGDVVMARSAMGPAGLEARNANLVGGDINGGAALLGQLFFRPTFRLRPYRIPLPGMYLCSASTPPGGGVHGMCGYHAARLALGDGY